MCSKNIDFRKITDNFWFVSIHLGEKIAFFIHEDENGGIALCSNMNPSQKITAEDLEDGTMLESSIHNFIREKKQDHFLDILKYDEDLFFPVFSNPEAI